MKTYAYSTLTDLGQFTQSIGAPLGQDIGSFMNQVMFAMIALAVVLAVFGVIRGGYVYMTSGDSADKKSKAKGILQAAFGGLLLAVGTVVILSTINPEILKGNFGPTRPLERLGRENVNLELETIRNSQNPNTFLSDGLQSSDAFFAGENSQFSNQILNMSQEQLTEYLNKQIQTEAGKKQYRDFLITLTERFRFYQNGDHTNNPEIITEMNRMNSLLEKFSGIDSSLNQRVYNEAVSIFTTRQYLGLTSDRGQTIPDGGRISGVENFNIAYNALLFATDDKDGILRLYASNGGAVQNNNYSSSIVQILNNESNYYGENNALEPAIKKIQNWVDQNGQSIGIKKTDNGYELLR